MKSSFGLVEGVFAFYLTFGKVIRKFLIIHKGWRLRAASAQVQSEKARSEKAQKPARIAILDSLSRLFPVLEESGEAFIGENMIGEAFNHRGRGCHNVRADQRTFFDVIGVTDRGGQYLRLVSVIIINQANIGNKLHPVQSDVVEAANKG